MHQRIAEYNASSSHVSGMPVNSTLHLYTSSIRFGLLNQFTFYCYSQCSQVILQAFQGTVPKAPLTMGNTLASPSQKVRFVNLRPIDM